MLLFIGTEVRTASGKNLTSTQLYERGWGIMGLLCWIFIFDSNLPGVQEIGSTFYLPFVWSYLVFNLRCCFTISLFCLSFSSWKHQENTHGLRTVAAFVILCFTRRIKTPWMPSMFSPNFSGVLCLLSRATMIILFNVVWLEIFWKHFFGF